MRKICAVSALALIAMPLAVWVPPVMAADEPYTAVMEKADQAVLDRR